MSEKHLVNLSSLTEAEIKKAQIQFQIIKSSQTQKDEINTPTQQSTNEVDIVPYEERPDLKFQDVTRVTQIMPKIKQNVKAKKYNKFTLLLNEKGIDKLKEILPNDKGPGDMNELRRYNDPEAITVRSSNLAMNATEEEQFRNMISSALERGLRTSDTLLRNFNNITESLSLLRNAELRNMQSNTNEFENELRDLRSAILNDIRKANGADYQQIMNGIQNNNSTLMNELRRQGEEKAEVLNSIYIKLNQISSLPVGIDPTYLEGMRRSILESVNRPSMDNETRERFNRLSEEIKSIRPSSKNEEEILARIKNIENVIEDEKRIVKPVTPSSVDPDRLATSLNNIVDAFSNKYQKEFSEIARELNENRNSSAEMLKSFANMQNIIRQDINSSIAKIPSNSSTVIEIKDELERINKTISNINNPSLYLEYIKKLEEMQKNIKEEIAKERPITAKSREFINKSNETLSGFKSTLDNFFDYLDKNKKIWEQASSSNNPPPPPPPGAAEISNILDTKNIKLMKEYQDMLDAQYRNMLQVIGPQRPDGQNANREMIDNMRTKISNLETDVSLVSTTINRTSREMSDQFKIWFDNMASNLNNGISPFMELVRQSVQSSIERDNNLRQILDNVHTKQNQIAKELQNSLANTANLQLTTNQNQRQTEQNIGVLVQTIGGLIQQNNFINNEQIRELREQLNTVPSTLAITNNILNNIEIYNNLQQTAVKITNGENMDEDDFLDAPDRITVNAYNQRINFFEREEININYRNEVRALIRQINNEGDLRDIFPRVSEMTLRYREAFQANNFLANEEFYAAASNVYREEMADYFKELEVTEEQYKIENLIERQRKAMKVALLRKSMEIFNQVYTGKNAIEPGPNNLIIPYNTLDPNETYNSNNNKQIEKQVIDKSAELIEEDPQPTVEPERRSTLTAIDTEEAKEILPYSTINEKAEIALREMIQLEQKVANDPDLDPNRILKNLGSFYNNYQHLLKASPDLQSKFDSVIAKTKERRDLELNPVQLEQARERPPLPQTSVVPQSSEDMPAEKKSQRQVPDEDDEDDEEGMGMKPPKGFTMEKHISHSKLFGDKIGKGITKIKSIVNANKNIKNNEDDNENSKLRNIYSYVNHYHKNKESALKQIASGNKKQMKCELCNNPYGDLVMSNDGDIAHEDCLMKNKLTKNRNFYKKGSGLKINEENSKTNDKVKQIYDEHRNWLMDNKIHEHNPDARSNWKDFKKSIPMNENEIEDIVNQGAIKPIFYSSMNSKQMKYHYTVLLGYYANLPVEYLEDENNMNLCWLKFNLNMGASLWLLNGEKSYGTDDIEIKNYSNFANLYKKLELNSNNIFKNIIF